MSEQSANQIYEFIVHWLRENELGWVARQIEQEIVIGKPKHGRIVVPKPPQQIAGREVMRKITKAPASAEFLAREDYTPLEKCEIAIGALDAVLTGAIKIHDSLLKTLNSGSVDPRIIFANNEDGEIIYSYQDSDLAGRRTKAHELSELLVELRKEVEA